MAAAIETMTVPLPMTFRITGAGSMLSVPSRNDPSGPRQEENCAQMSTGGACFLLRPATIDR